MQIGFVRDKDRAGDMFFGFEMVVFVLWFEQMVVDFVLIHEDRGGFQHFHSSTSSDFPFDS